MTQPGGGFEAVPETIRQVGQQVVALSRDVGSIVSAGAATIQLAGSGNAGFLTTPAMAALTVSHLAALKNLGSQLDQHGQDLAGSAQTYQAVDRDQQNAAVTAYAPRPDPWAGPATGPAGTV